MKEAEKIRKAQEQSLQETSVYRKIIEDIKILTKDDLERRNYVISTKLSQFDIGKLRSEGFGVTENENQQGQWTGYTIRW